MTTPRRLVLIRHSKAGDGLVDHARPLAPRGLRDAAGIGRWLGAHAVTLDLALVSTATRTRQTWAGAAAELGAPVVADFDDRIYDSAVDDLLDILHGVAADVSTVALVGHNPTMQDLAIYLDGSSGTSALGRAVRAHFPTSTVVVVEIGPVWAHLGAGDGTIAAFATPADF